MMLLVVLMFATIVSAGVSFVSLMERDKKVVIIAGMVLFVCVVWWANYAVCDWEVDQVLTSQCKTVNGVQVLVVTFDDTKYIYNVNKRFGKTFDEGQVFDVTFYKDGPYALLYGPEKHEVKPVELP